MRKGFAIFGVLMVLLNISCKQSTMDNSKKVLLDTGWTYKQVDGKLTGDASVPGTIHTDLLNNKQIKDPFYRTNEKDLQWIDKEDWEYATTVKLSNADLKHDRIALHFYGLDTYADVYFNEKLILSANNMHREWEVDVKSNAIVGDNALRILFHSPIKKGLVLYDASPYAYPASNDQSENGGLGEKKVSVFTRKAGYHYGWDWGPRFVTSGIWRPIELMMWNDIRILNLAIDQPQVKKELAKLNAHLTINSVSDLNGELILYNTTDQQEEILRKSVTLVKGSNELNLPFEIKNPKLWWSSGLGNPNMYDFKVQFISENNVLAQKEVSTGIRSIKLVREKDNDGESFLFELNGVRVFAKGANYIPNDNFLPRVTHADYKKVVVDAVNANMNMLRVWGGGVYEDDYFYDLCDRNGIMIWQDFMFACSMYPGNPEFLENVKQEAIDNVKRLRNHPSIALWCGNNEINTAWHYYSNGGWGWKDRYTKEQQEEIQNAYLAIFHIILPSVIINNTVVTNYWPSSPQAGYEPEKHATYETKSGDMHYWGVWHGLHRFEDFDKYKSRFMSEYGFQSFPEFNTVKKYTLPEDYNIESEVMAAHQRSGIGNLRIKEYLSWYYHVPKDFEHFLYLSQVLQAKSIRMAIESHRRAMPYCMGSLYWQINDCWPVASWSSTDYYHNWKAVHYAVKKAFEPVILSTLQNEKNIQIYSVSDLLLNKECTLKYEVIGFDGAIFKSRKLPVTLLANASEKILDIDLSILKNVDKTKSLLSIKLYHNDTLLTSKIHYFVLPKDQKLTASPIDAKIKVIGKNHYLELTSNQLVRNVYLSVELTKNVFFNDNYFDVLPGESKLVGLIGDVDNLNIDDIKIIDLKETQR